MASIMKRNSTLESQARDTGEEPLRLLIVEDCKAEQVRLEAMLCQLGYDVVTAETGLQGLDVLSKESISIVLSDWRMPGMSGIDLCRKVRSSPELGKPYFILVTACDNKCDLIAGMDAGADDFVTKPFNAEELRVRVQAGKRIILLRREAERRTDELQMSLKREADAALKIQRDLRTASRMQRELLPNPQYTIPGLSIAQLYQPLETVAGDSFNYYTLDHRTLAFFQCDVVGHGIASAMVSFALTRYLSPDSGMLLQRTPSQLRGVAHFSCGSHITAPEDVVAALNKRFLEKGDDAQSFTMIYGVLDIETGRGRLCQAGHPYPLILNAKGQSTELGSGGFPVGMLVDANYHGVDFHLEKGDRLVLYSDGISECHNSDGVAFNSKRLTTLLAKDIESTLDEQVSGLTQHLQAWRSETTLEDDVSLLVIERNDEQAQDTMVMLEN